MKLQRPVGMRRNMSLVKPTLADLFAAIQLLEGKIYGPAGMPREVTAKLNVALNAALNDPVIRERLLGQGWILAGGSAEALGALTRAEVERWAKVAKGAGIRLE